MKLYKRVNFECHQGTLSIIEVGCEVFCQSLKLLNGFQWVGHSLLDFKFGTRQTNFLSRGADGHKVDIRDSDRPIGSDLVTWELKTLYQRELNSKTSTIRLTIKGFLQA